MSTNGINGLIVDTHNWGKSVAFWRELGYHLEDSLVLRHPAGGPFIYLIEQPPNEPIEIRPIVAIDDAATFSAPAVGIIDRGFEPQHWGVSEMLLLDPDQRGVSVQAPLAPGAEVPEGHG